MSSIVPFQALAARASVASGWPRLSVLVADEAAARRCRAAVEAVLGPLPQADVLLPWDEGADEPVELRIDLPGLSWGALEPIVHVLEGCAGVAFRWSVGAPRAVTEAEDRGLRQVELLEVAGLRARLMIDPEEGRALSLDVVRPDRVDRAVLDLERQLAAAVRTVDPSLTLRSDRGPDTVAPLVHRTSGRFGVELSLGPDAFEGLDGDAVWARRRAVLAAVGEVIAARADDPVLQLAPDLRWDVPMGGLTLVLWIVAPPAPALPGDAAVVGEPAPSLVEALCTDVPAMVRELELQVVPVDGAHHVSAALAGASVAEAHGWPAGLPRWLPTSDGWRFAPTWRCPDPEPAALLAAARRLAARDEVRAVRVVPGEPGGLEEAWPTIEPAWWPGARRCWLRLRDGVRDRDHLERVEARPSQASDAALEAAWRGAIGGGAPLGEVRAVVDRQGRPGLEARPGRAAATVETLEPLLAAADALDEPHLCAVATLALPVDGPVLRLWWRVPVAPGPRVWRGQHAPRPLGDPM